MSVVPLMFRDWWDDVDRPTSRLIDQHFGSGLHRDDLLSGLSSLSLARPRSLFGGTGYYRPWRNVVRQNSGGASTVQADSEKFQVSDATSASECLSSARVLSAGLRSERVSACVDVT